MLRYAHGAASSSSDSSTAPSPWLSELNERIESVIGLPDFVELLIIGAGMTGVSLAYHLAVAHNTPSLVLDSREVSGGASGRNAGMLWPHKHCAFEKHTTEMLRAFIDSRDNNLAASVLLNPLGAVKLVGVDT